MDVGFFLVLWGSPVGIAIFFVGVGVLLWGVSKLKYADVAKAEVELKERQYQHERTREQKE